MARELVSGDKVGVSLAIANALMFLIGGVFISILESRLPECVC